MVAAFRLRLPRAKIAPSERVQASHLPVVLRSTPGASPCSPVPCSRPGHSHQRKSATTRCVRTSGLRPARSIRQPDARRSLTQFQRFQRGQPGRHSRPCHRGLGTQLWRFRRRESLRLGHPRCKDRQIHRAPSARTPAARSSERLSTRCFQRPLRFSARARRRWSLTSPPIHDALRDEIEAARRASSSAAAYPAARTESGGGKSGPSASAQRRRCRPRPLCGPGTSAQGTGLA